MCHILARVFNNEAYECVSDSDAKAVNCLLSEYMTVVI